MVLTASLEAQDGSVKYDVQQVRVLTHLSCKTL